MSNAAQTVKSKSGKTWFFMMRGDTPARLVMVAQNNVAAFKSRGWEFVRVSTIAEADKVLSDWWNRPGVQRSANGTYRELFRNAHL